MSAGPPRPDRRRTAALLLALGITLAALAWLDRGSLERGNRLFRDGDAATAAEVYRAADEDPRHEATYNLGTALVSEGLPGAETALERSVESVDSTVAQRANYNLGYSRLTRIRAEMPPDSAIPILSASVTSTRAALKMNPGDENARWNLALGQRMLDSLTFTQQLIDREQVAGEDELRLQNQALTRSDSGDGISGVEPEDPRPAENIGQRTGGATGAREAWAEQDPGPMAPAAAILLLAGLEDEPEQLVRGLLWAHRPDVAWWNDEPYPGGNW